MEDKDDQETDEEPTEPEETPEEETQEPEQQETEEEVKMVESETSVMDRFQSLGSAEVLVLGAFLGLMVGLGTGAALSGGSSGGFDEATASQNLQDLFEASTDNATLDIGVPERRNGLLYYNVTVEARGQNGTRNVNQGYYMSPDGALLIPAQGPLGQPVVRNVQQTIQQIEARQQRPAPPTTNGSVQ